MLVLTGVLSAVFFSVLASHGLIHQSLDCDQLRCSCAAAPGESPLADLGE